MPTNDGVMLPQEFKRKRIIEGVEVLLPKPPKKSDILNYKLRKDRQKWIPPKPPVGFDEMEEEEQIPFMRQEFKRREEGVFFYNNGNIEYMTGLHYFYCTYWKLDIGLPWWTDADRDFYYMWDHCENNKDCYGLFFITNRRSGKALDLNTPIPTPNGWSTMGELKEGDVVFDSRGDKCNVTFTTEIQHNRDCYELTFSDGNKIVADADHRWIAYNKSSRQHLNHPKWKAKLHEVTTKEMFDTQKVGKNETNWSIENCKPVDYDKKKLNIPPYILGLWLGDGTSTSQNITTVDDEILQSYTEYVESIGLKVSEIKHDKISYSAVVDHKDGKKWSINPFRQKLKDYNLFGNKHIPRDYLESSVEDRMELLKGLMDTDGSIDKAGRGCEYCSKLESLVDEVKELAESLGYKSYKYSKYNKKVDRTYYYLGFNVIETPPFKLKRKLERYKERAGGFRGNHRYITSIIPVESRPVRCIQVDSPDHSYLCGKSFITTHNTYKATNIIYEATSKVEEATSGMQSKTNVDAKKIFKKLIGSWKKLPYWLKPTDTGESNPSSALRFEEPGKRSSKGVRKDYKRVLNSLIDYAPATEEAYDGTKQYRLFHDEVGKKADADPHERYYICKPCLEQGSRIVGKCIMTTTVEDIDKDGGGSCKSLWDESDQSKLADFDDNRTITGMYRMFKPAYVGLEGFIDEYGYSVIETPKKPVMGVDGEKIKIGAKQWLTNRRSKLSGKLLIQEMRKFPWDIREAFMIDSADSPFDTSKIYSQKEYNDSMITPEYVTGNFGWASGERDTSVVWKPSPEGRWKVSYHPDPLETNKYRNFGGQRRPLENKIVGGCDPFDHKTTTANKKSDAASYGFLKYDPMISSKSNVFISEYINRPNTPEMFYEDMVMQCVYFGMTLLVENNKIGIVNYFRQRGYYDYLMTRPESTHTKYSKTNQTEKGIPLSGEAAREVLIERLESYIYEHIGINDVTEAMGSCPFDAVLNDWLNFMPDKWTDYDATVASGLAILASKKKTYKSEITFNPFGHIPKYDNSGSISRIIK